MIHVFDNIEEVVITQTIDAIIVVFPYMERHNMKLCGKWDVMTRNRIADTGIAIRNVNKPDDEFMINSKRVVLKQKEE